MRPVNQKQGSLYSLSQAIGLASAACLGGLVPLQVKQRVRQAESNSSVFSHKTFEQVAIELFDQKLGALHDATPEESQMENGYTFFTSRHGWIVRILGISLAVPPNGKKFYINNIKGNPLCPAHFIIII